MAAFHVFVEGPVDRSVDGVRKLAEAMARRYGLPAGELVSRMSKGRFRVKANLDPDTASTYVRDLEKLGARVVLEEAGASDRSGGLSLPPPTRERSGPVARTTPSPVRGLEPVRPTPTPAPTPSHGTEPSRPTPPPARSTPPGSFPAAPAPRATPFPERRTAPPVARTSTAQTLGEPRRPTPPPGAEPRRHPPTPGARPAPFQSGLAAAFSVDGPAQSLGALESADLALSTVDGAAPPRAMAAPPAYEPPGIFDDQTPAPTDPTDPPTIPLRGGGAAVQPAIAAKPGAAKPAAKPPRPKDVPVDLFAPPDAGARDFVVELAPDELEHQARKRASIPPALAEARAPAAPSSPPLRRSQPSLRPPTGSSSSPAAAAAASPAAPTAPLGSGPLATLASPRARFAAGVAVAIVLGFLPAHLIAAARERAAYREIDDRVVQVQPTLDAAALDAFRLEQRDHKLSARRTIAATSIAIWALVGAGLAYVWFRRVPWDRWLRGER